MATEIQIADKQTLDAVNAKAGANTDVAGTNTLFARLKQIYDYLAGNLNATVSSRATQTTADTIKSSVGDAGDIANPSGSIHAKLSSIQTSINSPVVYNASPSDTVKVLLPTQKTTNTFDNVLAKRFVSPITGIIRLKADIKNSDTSTFVVAPILVNGIGIKSLPGGYYTKSIQYSDGGAFSSSSDTYVTGIMDIFVRKGDYVEVMLRVASGKIGYLSNFKVCYDEVTSNFD